MRFHNPGQPPLHHGAKGIKVIRYKLDKRKLKHTEIRAYGKITGPVIVYGAHGPALPGIYVSKNFRTVRVFRGRTVVESRL